MPDEDLKVCSRCHVAKPFTEFYSVQSSRYGRLIWLAACRLCKSLEFKARYVPRPKLVLPEKTKEEKLQYQRDWYKQNPGKRAAYLKAWKANNREKHEEQTAVYYWKNRERRAEYERKRRKVLRETQKAYWRAQKLAQRLAKHKRRNAGWRHDVPAIQAAIAECLESYRIGDQYWDVYAGKLIDKPTIDHIVPVTYGGAHTADNFCVTSLENNASKGNQSILIWLAKLVKRNAAAVAGSSRNRSRAQTAPENETASNVSRERSVPKRSVS